MRELRGLCGFSKVAAQTITEKQSEVTVLEFMVPAVLIELDKNGTHIIPNPM